MRPLLPCGSCPGVKGVICKTGELARVHSYGPHHGEEDPLRGWNGSGTIIFSGCNLRCVYCQNWEISHKGLGEELSPVEISAMMLQLQARGCDNINLVSPSHIVAQFIAAVALAAKDGLRLPLVYNTGGYDSPEALSLLDGIIDIYMPDMKYGVSAMANKYSRIRHYVEVNRRSVQIMHQQVGDLIMDHNGLARRGLLVRHLVLPNRIAGTERVLRFLAEKISTHTYLNLMGQYHPCYRADTDPNLNRPLRPNEYRDAQILARQCGLTRLDQCRPSLILDN